MGYRLQGPSLSVNATRFVISEGTVHGALQVPPDGQPILLMADRQTTGGYPQLAAVMRQYRRRIGRRWTVDEVFYFRGKQKLYLYRAVDEHRQVIEVLLRSARTEPGRWPSSASHR